MEPTNLNPSPSGPDPLEALLRESMSAELPDGGFSARVLAALPPRTPTVDWRRIAVCAAGAGIGLTLALATGNKFNRTVPNLEQLSQAVVATLAPLSDPQTVVTLVVVAAAIAFAWRGGDWRLSR